MDGQCAIMIVSVSQSYCKADGVAGSDYSLIRFDHKFSRRMCSVRNGEKIQKSSDLAKPFSCHEEILVLHFLTVNPATQSLPTGSGIDALNL